MKQRDIIASLASITALLALAACGSEPAPEAGPDMSASTTTAQSAATSAKPASSAAPTTEASTSTAATTEPVQSAEETSAAPAPVSITSNPEGHATAEGKMWGGDDYDPTVAARMPHGRLDPGESTDILGTTTTICSTGDAYGIHYVGASEGVDCVLANGVAEAALKDESASDNVHFDTPKPVRFEGKTFTCTEQGKIVLTCVDDSGDSVLMW